MTFLIVMINVFALAAFIVLWLSITFLAVHLYKTSKNTKIAVSLARISIILKLLLVIWFVLLSIAFTTADNFFPLIIFLVFIVGLYVYISKMYGNLLGAVSEIRKDDGTKAKHELICNSVVEFERINQGLKSRRNYRHYNRFFWGLNLFVCAITLINFWLADNRGAPLWEIILASITMVVLLQILFVPIYLIVKRIIFATLAES